MNRIRLQPALVILFFAALSVVLGGYESFSSDQLLYVPYFLHNLGATFSPFDQLIQFNQGAWSIFADIFELILRVPQPAVFWVMFAVFFAARVLYFYALYRLANFFAQDKRIGLWVPLVFIGGMLVYGTVSGTLDNELIPRALALPVSLWGLSLLVYSKRLYAALSFTLAFLIHPLTGLVFFAVLYLYALIQLWRRQSTLSSVVAWLIPMVGAIALTLIKSLPSGGALFIDPAWQAVLVARDTFVYLSAWPGYASTLLLALPLDFCALLYVRSKLFAVGSVQRYWFNLLFVLPLMAIGVSLVGVDWLQLHPLAQLQILRTLIFWKLLLALGFGIYVFKVADADWLKKFLVFATAAALVVTQTVAFATIPALLVLEYVPNRRGRVVSIAVCVLAAVGLELLSWLHLKTEPNLDLNVVAVFMIASIVVLIRRYRINVLRWGSELAFGGIVACGVLLAANQSFVLPQWTKDAGFMRACAWLQQNTQPSDVILTEPYSDVAYVRIACVRSIYTSDKDGAMGLFDRTYALEWQQRQNMVRKIYDDPALAYTLGANGVRYVFAQKQYRVPFTPVFDADSYVVYSLTK